MGKGIAVEFKKRFGRVDELLQQKKDVGDFAFIKSENRYVFYLVTKQRYFHKPSLKSLQAALQQLKLLATKLEVTSVSMPRIGSGLDQLDWKSVSESIMDTFNESGIKIRVYTL